MINLRDFITVITWDYVVNSMLLFDIKLVKSLAVYCFCCYVPDLHFAIETGLIKGFCHLINSEKFSFLKNPEWPNFSKKKKTINQKSKENIVAH